MFRRRFFIYSVKLPRAVEFYISRVDGFLYISGYGSIKPVELFNCFYKDGCVGEEINVILSLKFFSRRLFKGVLAAVGTICCDFF